MRPNIYDRKSQVMVRFLVPEEIKKKLKIYAVENDTSFQQIFEEVAMKLIEDKKGE